MMLSVVKMLLIWCIAGIVAATMIIIYGKCTNHTNAEIVDIMPNWFAMVLVVFMLPLILMKYVWSAMKGDWQ